MFLTLVYLFFGETLEQRRSMLTEFNKSQLTIVNAETALKSLGDAAFRGPSRDGRSITAEQAEKLYSGVQNLRSNLAAMSPPNRSIENTSNLYIGSLTTLQGSLNLFEEGEEGTLAVLDALAGVEIPATYYGLAVKDYQTSVITSFLAAF